MAVVMWKTCMMLWHEAHIEINMYKARRVRSTFGSCDVQKVHDVAARSTFRSQSVQSTPCSEHFWKLRCSKRHAVVARSTFRSQSVQSTLASEHFWKLRCSKSALRFGAKYISMSKMYKTPHVRATFGR